LYPARAKRTIRDGRSGGPAPGELTGARRPLWDPSLRVGQRPAGREKDLEIWIILLIFALDQ